MQCLVTMSEDAAVQGFLTRNISAAGGTIPLHVLQKMHQLRFGYPISFIVNGETLNRIRKEVHVLYRVDDEENVHLPEREVTVAS